jgi:hypothetical protein
MIYSVHFTSFFLILYSIFLMEVLWLSKISLVLLLVLIILDLLILIVYLALSLKKVFSFSWAGTILRMALICIVSFSVYQILHYTISYHSGR